VIDQCVRYRDTNTFPSESESEKENDSFLLSFLPSLVDSL